MDIVHQKPTIGTCFGLALSVLCVLNISQVSSQECMAEHVVSKTVSEGEFLPVSHHNVNGVYRISSIKRLALNRGLPYLLAGSKMCLKKINACLKLAPIAPVLFKGRVPE